MSGKVAASDSGIIGALLSEGLGIGPLMNFEAAQIGRGQRPLTPVMREWALPQVPLFALLPARTVPARVRAFLDFIYPHLQER